MTYGLTLECPACKCSHTLESGRLGSSYTSDEDVLRLYATDEQQHQIESAGGLEALAWLDWGKRVFDCPSCGVWRSYDWFEVRLKNGQDFETSVICPKCHIRTTKSVEIDGVVERTGGRYYPFKCEECAEFGLRPKVYILSD